MARLLYVTQARFWNWDNATRLRIKNLIEALANRKILVEVFFLGELTDQDITGFSKVISSVVSLSGCSANTKPGNRMREGIWQFRLMPTIEFVRCLIRRVLLGVLPHRLRAGDSTLPEWLFVGLRYFLDESPYAYASEHDEKSLIAHLAAFDPTVVCVSRLDGAWTLRACRGRGIPTLLDSHDVVFQRRTSLMRGALINNIFSSEALEIFMLAQADVVLAIQLADTYAFRSLLPSVDVIHVGQPFNAIVCSRPPQSLLTFGFMGSESVANGAALQEILETLWPQIYVRAGRPVRLVVAGRVSKNVTKLSLGVENQGVVGAVECFYDEVDVILSVVRFGGGLKFKTVEGLAFGKAVIATDCGAEGLSQAVDFALIRADTIEAIVNAAVELTQRSEVLQQQKALAYETARAHFSADSVYAQMFDTVEELAKRPTKSVAPVKQ